MQHLKIFARKLMTNMKCNPTLQWNFSRNPGEIKS